jgi:hypothetical protein
MKKKVILSIAAIVFLMIFFAQRIYNKPYLNVEKASSDIVITSENLLNNYIEDEGKSNTAYLEKVIEVSGRITEIIREQDSNVITLSGGNMDGNVICYLLDGNEKIDSFNIGDSLVIKGICTGYLLDVILVRCVLIK